VDLLLATHLKIERCIPDPQILLSEVTLPFIRSTAHGSLEESSENITRGVETGGRRDSKLSPQKREAREGMSSCRRPDASLKQATPCMQRLHSGLELYHIRRHLYNAARSGGVLGQHVTLHLSNLEDILTTISCIGWPSVTRRFASGRCPPPHPLPSSE